MMGTVQMVANAQKLKSNCRKVRCIAGTVLLQNLIVLGLIFGYRLLQIFWLPAIYNIIELILCCIILCKVKNGQATDRLMRYAKILLITTIVIIAITGITVICMLIFGKVDVYFLIVALPFCFIFTLCTLTPRVIALIYVNCSK